MKRRSWWMALFAPQAVAQGLTAPSDIGPSRACTIPRSWCGKAKPNECPVCGTMAKPYVRSVEGMNGACFANCLPWTINDLPKSQQIRCSHCNVSFWQDAEN